MCSVDITTSDNSFLICKAFKKVFSKLLPIKSFACLELIVPFLLIRFFK